MVFAILQLNYHTSITVVFKSTFSQYIEMGREGGKCTWVIIKERSRKIVIVSRHYFD
jgi:hypothetical protein